MADNEPAARAKRSWQKPALVALAVLAVVGAWGWFRYGQPHKDDTDILIVGDQKGGVAALLRASGELDHVPYKIDWALFPAAAPLLEALNSDAVDIGGIGGQPFAFAYASGAKIKVVYAGKQIDGPTRGQSSAIVVPGNSPLHRVEDLRGHRLATIRGSAGQDLALRLLERHGLKPGDVTWVYLNNAEAKGALATGSVDAWSTWGAYVGFALLKDNQRAIGDARELAAQAGFFAANDHAIATKRALITDFLGRLTRARQWAVGHREAYAKVLAHETGLPEDVALFATNDVLSAPVPVDDNLRAEQLDILRRYQAAGIITKIPDLTGAFDGSLLPKP